MAAIPGAGAVASRPSRCAVASRARTRRPLPRQSSSEEDGITSLEGPSLWLPKKVSRVDDISPESRWMSRTCRPHSSPRRTPETTTSHRYIPMAAWRTRASVITLATSSGLRSARAPGLKAGETPQSGQAGPGVPSGRSG